jgi:sodium/potassium-transporting ATPase subunit alpha
MANVADENNIDNDLRITFQEDVERDADRGRLDRGAGGATRARSMSRASSRSSRSRIPVTSPYTGVQIEYRTLSIHVSESRHQEPESSEDWKGSAKQAEDYFANLTYHELAKEQICQQLNVAPDQGLSDNAAATRLQRDGRNTLPQPRVNYMKKLFFYIFGGFCSVLWVGVIIFFICWQPLSNPPSPTNLALAILVLIVIMLQAAFNAFQDWSTSRTMKSIVDLLPSETRVLREGKLISLPATELVAGDIIHLSMGNKVPADLRLLEHSGDIRFDRSMLTGEPEEVEGAINGTDPNFLESRNIALMGTMVVNGSGTGIVVLTGSRSVMGRIAQGMANAKEVPTLIQQEIWRFVRIIVVFTVILALLIALSWTFWLRRDHPSYMNVVAMLNNVMGCVVAFIPEGMPIAVSLTLMMVARRMKASNILPKGLSTVETLGCVNVICSDKTGTLTQNVMSVASVAFADNRVSPEHVRQALGEKGAAEHMNRLYAAASLCNDATFDPTTQHLPLNERKIQGNATDAALLRFIAPIDARIRTSGQKIFQIPFNSKNKWMLTMLNDGESPNAKTSQYQVYVKGAPDVLLPACTKYWSAKTGSVERLDDATRSSLKSFQDQLSRNAERVILLCGKTMNPVNTLGTNAFSDEVAATALEQLVIIGMLGILDPPRPEAIKTVSECRRAGARFFMVTGDYGLTAAAIARNIGIFSQDAQVDDLQLVRASSSVPPTQLREKRLGGEGRSLLIEGKDISSLSDDDWNIICEYEEIVFARTTPEQKLRIVNE